MSIYASPFDPKVTLTHPNNMDTNVENDTSVEITFNKDLDKNFIQQYIHVYNESGDKITGTVTYKEKVVIFKPTDDFQTGDTVRVVVIGDDLSGKNIGIRNILGNRMKGNYQFSFTVKNSGVVHSPTLVSPQNQELIKIQPTFKWEAKPAQLPSIDYYQIQVSKSNIMSSVVWPSGWETYEIAKDDNTVIPNLELEDGTYYWRMRTVSIEEVKSNWSPIYTFNIDTMVYGASTPEDDVVVDIPFFDYYDGADFEVLEIFPEDKASSISLNLKQIGIKLSGIMSVPQINHFINSFRIEGEYVDKSGSGHSGVSIINNGNISDTNNPKYIIDNEAKTTTIIFTLKPIA